MPNYVGISGHINFLRGKERFSSGKSMELKASVRHCIFRNMISLKAAKNEERKNKEVIVGKEEAATRQDSL